MPGHLVMGSFPMDLLGYFRMLRRRWVLILVLTLLGAAIGTASGFLGDSSGTGSKHTFYKATNTLVLDPTSSGAFQSAFTNLDQIAILTTTGSVPSAVAADIGVDEQGLTDHIVTTANSATNTLEITAAEPTSDEAVRVADAFAAQLIAGLQKRDTDRYNAQRTYLSTRIDSLNNTVNGLRAQLAGDPTNQVIAAQLNAAANELGIAYSDFGNLTATGPPTSRLSVLEPAQAVPINQAEYDSRLNLGALGQNHLTGGVSADQPVISTTQSSGKLNGPVARGLLGALLGLFCGLGLAILLERLHRRIRAHEDAEEAFGLPVLAEVPKLARGTRSRSWPRARLCPEPRRPIERYGRRSSSHWPRKPTNSARVVSTATAASLSSSTSPMIPSW